MEDKIRCTYTTKKGVRFTSIETWSGETLVIDYPDKPVAKGTIFEQQRKLIDEFERKQLC